MSGIPTLEELQKFVVNKAGWEVIRQPFFDSAAYPAAGATTLSFFATPKGQGTSVLGGGPKTQSDTNMTLAGQLPAMQAFLIECIEVAFQPTTPSVAAQLPAAFGAKAIAQIVNDAYVFRRSGNLNLTIGSKPYLEAAPLMIFPASADFQVSAALADSTTAAADSQSRIAYGKSVGRPYSLGSAPIFLTANQNFSITLAWPEGLQALPSTNPARIVVSMFGLLYRRSQ